MLQVRLWAAGGAAVGRGLIAIWPPRGESTSLPHDVLAAGTDSSRKAFVHCGLCSHE